MRYEYGLQGAELLDGVGPPPQPRPAVLRALEGPDGLVASAVPAPRYRNPGSALSTSAFKLPRDSRTLATLAASSS